jgi:hypothetical protein
MVTGASEVPTEFAQHGLISLDFWEYPLKSWCSLLIVFAFPAFSPNKINSGWCHPISGNKFGFSSH